MLKRLLPPCVFVLVAGCGSVFGPDERQVVGVIEGFGTDAPAVVMPASAQAGQDFTIEIRTTWPNGCARKDETVVRQKGEIVTVTPYDVVTEGGACTQAPQQFTHTATLRFYQPGPVQVVVQGRPSHNAAVGVVTREVTVR